MMDYSTISNKTNCTEAEDITNGELSERYYLLKKQYDSLSSTYESVKQELHDTKRCYQTALDVQSHLNAELESYQADEGRRKNEVNNRISALQEEISSLREQRTELVDSHASEVKKFEAEIRRLKEEKACIREASPVKDTSELDEARAAVSSALSDAAAAKAALEEARAEVLSWRMKAEELVSEMGEIRAAADLRREELRAAGEREAAALADLAEARAMLHQCTDSQDLQPHAAKGNSIFAEVEDKRQEMAKNLIQMKQTNSRILCALSFFANGSYQKILGKNVNTYMSQPSASRAIKLVVEALSHPSIVRKYIKFPQTITERQDLKERFFKQFKIPGVIGCIDGTLVSMIRPQENEERYFCRKGYHARNVLILRRELANKQAEVDTLLHEKLTVWEQQAGAAAHYDKELIESYEDRITQLEGLCERQRRELARWFGKLSETSAHDWLPGVLDHLKSECETLRAQVLSLGVAQLASAAQVRELRRKLAAAAQPARPPPARAAPAARAGDSGAPTLQARKPAPDDVKKKVSFN